LQSRLDRVREFAEEGEVAVLRRRLADSSAATLARASTRAVAPGALTPR
jgi:hypothetical protein